MRKISDLLISTVILLMGFIFSSCSDPKSPNKSNFEKAINKHISDSVIVSSFKANEIDSKVKEAIESNNLRAVHDNYVGGRLTVNPNDAVIFFDEENSAASDLEKINVLIPCFADNSLLDSLKNHPRIVVEQGRKYLIRDKDKGYAKIWNDGEKTRYDFYCGRIAVKEIKSWTEPSTDSSGHIVCSVKFVYGLVDAPKWAERTILKYAWLEHDSVVDMMLTNEGWVVNGSIF